MTCADAAASPERMTSRSGRDLPASRSRRALTLRSHFVPHPRCAPTFRSHFVPHPRCAPTFRSHFVPHPRHALTLRSHFVPHPRHALTLRSHFVPPTGVASGTKCDRNEWRRHKVRPEQTPDLTLWSQFVRRLRHDLTFGSRLSRRSSCRVPFAPSRSGRTSCRPQSSRAAQSATGTNGGGTKCDWNTRTRTHGHTNTRTDAGAADARQPRPSREGRGCRRPRQAPIFLASSVFSRRKSRAAMTPPTTGATM